MEPSKSRTTPQRPGPQSCANCLGGAASTGSASAISRETWSNPILPCLGLGGGDVLAPGPSALPLPLAGSLATSLRKFGKTSVQQTT